MKNFIAVLFGIIFSNMIFAQTFNVSFNDIYSTDSLSAWVVGDEGTILHIIDGGTSFEDHSFPTSFNLQSICFVDEQKGFIVGHSGIILRTDDGGETWNTVNLGITNDLNSVEFYNNQYGWINVESAWGSLFFRTIDGGNTWITIITQITATSFIDSLSGWGRMGYKIARTNDGGVSWSIISDLSGPFGVKICFTDTLTGFHISNAMGHSFSQRTNDGGFNWTDTNLPSQNHGLSDICFLDSVNGWVCGTNSIFYSNDLFESFVTFTPTGYTNFNSLSVHGYSNGWAASYDLGSEQSSIWKLDGINNWIQLNLVGMPENDNSKTSIKCFPNPSAEIVTIELEMNIMENIKISIHDQLGKEIETLFEGKKNKKTFQLTWDSGNLPTGVYLLKLQTDNGVITQKIIKN